MIFILVSVVIACVTIFLTVWLTNRNTNKCMERIIRHSTEVSERSYERIEKGFLRHYTALFYAMDIASRENRAITPDDYRKGLDFAEKVMKEPG